RVRQHVPHAAVPQVRGADRVAVLPLRDVLRQEPREVVPQARDLRVREDAEGLEVAFAVEAVVLRVRQHLRGVRDGAGVEREVAFHGPEVVLAGDGVEGGRRVHGKLRVRLREFYRAVWIASVWGADAVKIGRAHV